MRVLVRGIGANLADYGVENTLKNPLLEVYGHDNTLLAQNNDWDAELSSTFSQVGAFALTPGSKDAALVLELGPGAFTVQLKGSDGGTGEALIEVYELPRS